MKTIEELLKNLARPEVLEFGLVTNRLPSVNIGGKFEPVDDEAPSTERLMQMLVTMGGSRYVDTLNDKPVQWTTRLDGVGVIAVAAIMRKEVVQARFTVAKRESAGATSATARAAGVTATQQSAGTPARTRESEKNPAATPQRPPAALGRTQESRSDATKPIPAPTPSPQPATTKPSSSAQQPVAQPASSQGQRAAQPASGTTPIASTNAGGGGASAAAMAAVKQTAQIQPQAIKSVTAAAAASSSAAAGPTSPPISATQQQPQPQPRPAAGQPADAPPPPVVIQQGPPPPDDEWDDDDEPTLQTLSPPVSAPPPGAGNVGPGAAAGTATSDPRPKPARRPEEVSRPDAEEVNAAAATAAAAAAAAQARAATEARERAAAEQKAAQERAALERAAQERAAQERAAQEQRAQQERAAQERAAQERAAQERAAQERAAQERAAQERAAQERAAQERAAQERAAQERAAQERATQERVQREREARAAQEKLARERAAAADAARAKHGSPMAGSGRRINTPTSVDAVDVEITTNDAGSGKAKPVTIDIDLDADGADNTVSVPGAGDKTRAGGAGTPAPAKVQAGQPASATAKAAQPATTTAKTIAEKDRPRVESSAALDAFLAMALAARASDLHIIASRPVLLRVATDLLPRTQAVPPEHVERIAKEIVPARLRETLERDGSCDFAVEHTTHGRFRVNVSKQRTGFKINLRVIPKDIASFQALGLPDALPNLLRHTRGLVLVTGPASHGKSTTLAAIIDYLNRETARHIVTIEEPIEQVHPRKKGLVSQREIGLHARTRVRAIQNAIREDMDTLVIGELRDRDSMRLALTACESGRLVLATMNMPSAAKTIDRIRDLFAPAEEPWVRQALASSLRLIIGQRLIPSADRTRLHAAVELLPWSVALYGIIREGRTHQIATLQQRGKPLGIVRLDESLAELVRAQKVTIEVAKQFAESPADLESQAAAPGARASLTATPQAARKA